MKLDWLKIVNRMRSFHGHGFSHHLLILLIRIFHVILNMFPNVISRLDPVLHTLCVIKCYTIFLFVDFSSNLALNTKWTTASTNGIPNEVSLSKEQKSNLFGNSVKCIYLRVGNFPKKNHSREREFPEISLGIPGNSRELKTHYIKTENRSQFWEKCNSLTNFIDFQHGCYLFRQ